MRDISFIDKTFDNARTENYHLSVQISPDGLFFAILDLIKGKYIVLKGYNFFLKRPRFLLKQVKEIVGKDEMIRMKYKSINILYATNLFTLIPSAFYKDGYASDYIKFHHSFENGFIIMKDLFRQANAWCLFEMPENLSDYLKDNFPKANIRHNLCSLVEKALKDSLNYPTRSQIHLNFFRDNFETSVINGVKLLQYNSFNYKNERDILYHILFIFDQLSLSPEESEVIIHGHIPQVSPVYHLIKKYIRNTSFAKSDTTFQYSYTFNQLPEHYFTSLLNVYQCE